MVLIYLKFMIPKNLIPNIVDFELFLFQWSKKKATFVEFFSNKWSLTNSFDLEIAWTFQNNTTNLKISQLCPKCCALCFEKKINNFCREFEFKQNRNFDIQVSISKGGGMVGILPSLLPTAMTKRDGRCNDNINILLKLLSSETDNSLRLGKSSD